MRYLHYMPVPSPIYNHTVIDLVKNNENIPGEHIFFLRDKKCYDQNCSFEGVFFKKNYSMERFNEDAKQFDYIIVHGLNFNFFEQLQINKNTAKKIVWCVWGHDLYKERDCVFNRGVWISLKSLMKKILIRIIWIPFVRKFNSICVSFPYDRLEINRLIGKEVRVLPVTYGLGYDFELVKSVKQNSLCYDKTEEINFMVGHCSYPFLNHIEILEHLKQYKEENIKIYMPLSYGDKEYTEQLLDYLQTYPLHVEVIRDFLSPEEYIALLARMDIAVFDYKHQAALANIYLLLYLGKKIYLNLSGIIAKGLQLDKVTVFDVNDLGKKSFNEIADFDYSSVEGVLLSESVLNPETIIRQWVDLFNLCERE